MVYSNNIKPYYGGEQFEKYGAARAGRAKGIPRQANRHICKYGAN